MMRRIGTPQGDLPSEETLRAALDHSGYAVIHSLIDDGACAALGSGVAEIRRGARRTLGVIFHDAL